MHAATSRSNAKLERQSTQAQRSGSYIEHTTGCEAVPQRPYGSSQHANKQTACVAWASSKASHHATEHALARVSTLNTNIPLISQRISLARSCPLCPSSRHMIPRARAREACLSPSSRLPSLALSCLPACKLDGPRLMQQAALRSMLTTRARVPPAPCAATHRLASHCDCFQMRKKK